MSRELMRRVSTMAYNGRRTDDDAPVEDKWSMTLRSTPLKDVETTTKLSLKSGYLMKRDKQG
jgi:hypothetical protein